MIIQLRHRLLAALVAMAFAPLVALAQAPASDAGPRVLKNSERDRLAGLMEQIQFERADIVTLGERLEAAAGDSLAEPLLGKRRDALWSEMVHHVLDLAEQLAALTDDGYDVSEFSGDVVSYLSTLPDEAMVAIERLRERAVLPTGELPPREFVFKDQELFEATRALDDIYRSLLRYQILADRYDVDTGMEPGFVVDRIAESAQNRSVFLELALEDARHLRGATTALPEDTELAAWQSAAEARVRLAAESLQDVIDLMEMAGQETRLLRRQVLTVTGEITTDILDVGIVTSLVSEWSKAAFQFAAQEGPRWIFRLLLVFLILFVFIQLAKLVQRGVERAMRSAGNRVSSLLSRMVVASVKNVIIIIGALIAISQLGVSLGPLLAGLGIAGFIIGFALQDSLSNFASGVMILMYRPFDVGDVVDAAGVHGRVSSMSLVNTTFMTLDNQRLVVPNNMIWQSVITNVTAQRTRRIDLVFGISYSDDIEKVEAVLWDILKNNEAVLDDPEPIVRVHELGESSVNFAVRPWVNTTDYWDTYWSLTKAVKMRFDEEGISIPFPQRDVHVIEQKAT
jgi:small conductance mechanosensitive channel